LRVRRDRWTPAGVAFAGGVAAFLSLPPIGWWPLGPVGLAGLCWSLGRAGARLRFACGALFGAGLLAPGLWWLLGFTGPGYPIAVVVLAAVYGAGAALVPRGPGRWAAFPAAVAGAELTVDMWPFGGVPMAELSQGQALGPLLGVARLAGAVGVTAAAALAGAGLCALVEWRSRRGTSPWTAVACLAAAVVVAVGGALAPDGGAPVGTLNVAAVQGGGPRGVRAALSGNADRVFQAQVTAEAQVSPPVDLVVWPENVLELSGPLDGSGDDSTMRELAAEIGAPIVAGVTVPVGTSYFLNEVFAWSPGGGRTGPVVKVHRVPFGEWIPLRGLLRHLADLSAVPRDEIGGHGGGVLGVPSPKVGPVAVLISYEVFFDERVLSGVRGGGRLVVVPTNASSYVSSQVPSMEVAAARLRAVGTGRDLAQAAPTGFSALVDHRGRVLARSGLGTAAVLDGRLSLRRGFTVFDHAGLWLDRGLVLAGLVAGLLAGALRRRARPLPDGPRADQGDGEGGDRRTGSG